MMMRAAAVTVLALSMGRRLGHPVPFCDYFHNHEFSLWADGMGKTLPLTEALGDKDAKVGLERFSRIDVVKVQKWYGSS